MYINTAGWWAEEATIRVPYLMCVRSLGVVLVWRSLNHEWLCVCGRLCYVHDSIGTGEGLHTVVQRKGESIRKFRNPNVHASLTVSVKASSPLCTVRTYHYDDPAEDASREQGAADAVTDKGHVDAFLLDKITSTSPQESWKGKKRINIYHRERDTFLSVCALAQRMHFLSFSLSPSRSASSISQARQTHRKTELKLPLSTKSWLNRGLFSDLHDQNLFSELCWSRMIRKEWTPSVSVCRCTTPAK